MHLFVETLTESNHPSMDEPGTFRLRTRMPQVLMPGTYTVDLWVGTPYEDYAWHERAVSFTIAATDRKTSNDRILGLDMPWTSDRIGS